MIEKLSTCTTQHLRTSYYIILTPNYRLQTTYYPLPTQQLLYTAPLLALLMRRTGIVLSIIFGSLGLLLLLTIGIVTAIVLSTNSASLGKGHIGVIKVNGVITTGSAGLFAEDIASSESIVARLEELNANKDIKAIILDINSPGGSPVASDEIGTALKRVNKPTVTVIRDVGASGAYWVASATEYIIANRMSVTGSIGVTATSLGFEDLIKEYNITYRRQVSGRLKDVGTPFREPTAEEDELMQELLDTIREEFIREVAQNRNLSVSTVRELATGYVYLGSQAKDVGLIDELGGVSEARAYLERTHGITGDLAEFNEKPGLFDLLGQLGTRTAYAMGNGIGSSLIKDRFEILL